MDGLLFELEAFVMWSDEGLPAGIVYPGMLAPDGSPVVGGRHIPELLLAADGTVWLAGPGLLRTVRLTGAGPGRVFRLDEAGVEGVMALAATERGGLVLFGEDEDNAILARLSSSGELVWRRDDLPPAQASCARVQLAVDLDGSVYLFTADRPAGEGGTGEVLRVGFEDGALSKVAGFEEKPPKEVWVREGALYWVVYDEGTRTWVSRDVATGEERAVEARGELRYDLLYARGVVPGGGALIGQPGSDALIWMGTDGEEADRVGLVNVVRAGEGLAAAVKEDGVLALARRVGGEMTGMVEIDEPTVPVDLVYVDGDEYHLWNRGAGISAVDAGGRVRLVTADPSEVNRLLMECKGGVSVTGIIVAEDGSLLLAGADPEGAFVVRLTRR